MKRLNLAAMLCAVLLAAFFIRAAPPDTKSPGTFQIAVEGGTLVLLDTRTADLYYLARPALYRAGDPPEGQWVKVERIMSRPSIAIERRAR